MSTKTMPYRVLFSRQSRILQLTVLSPKTREPVETCDTPQLPKPVPRSLKVQDGDSRVNSHIPETRGMGNLNRPLSCIFTSPHSTSIEKVSQVPSQRHFSSLPFMLARAPLVFTSLVKEVKLLALKQDISFDQYLDDWLIRAPSQAKSKRHTAKLLTLVRTLGFVVNLQKSELIPQQRFDFIGYHFFARSGSCQTISE